MSPTGNPSRTSARPSRGPSRSGTAQKILDDAARELQRSGIEARYRFISADRRTPVPEAISREADRCHADLVVVGSEGRDSLDEWVVGGTALRLIYVARRPVTVVRAPRRRKAS